MIKLSIAFSNVDNLTPLCENIEGDIMNFFDKYELNNCPCGKDHSFSSDIIIGDGVINQLPDALKAKGIKRSLCFLTKTRFPPQAKQLKSF